MKSTSVKNAISQQISNKASCGDISALTLINKVIPKVTKNYLIVKFAEKSWQQRALWNDTFTIDTVEEGLSTAWFVPNLSNKRTTWKDIWILYTAVTDKSAVIWAEKDCWVVESAERNLQKDSIWKCTCVFTMGKGLTTVKSATRLSNIQAV